MKLVLFVFCLVILLLFGYKFIQQKRLIISPSTFQENISPTPHQKESLTSILVKHEETSYRILYTKLAGQTITIIPNYQTKKAAATIVEENTCKAASSGGFYKEDNKPLGLLKINNELFNPESNDTRLLTGFFFIGKNNTVGIGKTYPDDAPTVLQSGPYFTSANRLQLRQDGLARRIMIIEDTSGQFYLAAITMQENTHSGPLLANLPPILFSIKEPFRVTSILNLDGGSASFFMDESGYTLSELTYVGSLICIR
ncbi:hypothetical protein HY468_02375 [Candidatus Roizmanbacteria bacterium]|nr:hypothetical protein [Candidatus Roizmanbacteria bacterium]